MADSGKPSGPKKTNQFNHDIGADLIEQFNAAVPDGMTRKEVAILLVRYFVANPETVLAVKNSDGVARRSSKSGLNGLIDVIPDFRRHDFSDVIRSAKSFQMYTGSFDFFLKLPNHYDALKSRMYEPEKLTQLLFASPPAKDQKQFFSPVPERHVIRRLESDYQSALRITGASQAPDAGFFIKQNLVVDVFPKFFILADWDLFESTYNDEMIMHWRGPSPLYSRKHFKFFLYYGIEHQSFRHLNGELPDTD